MWFPFENVRCGTSVNLMVLSFYFAEGDGNVYVVHRNNKMESAAKLVDHDSGGVLLVLLGLAVVFGFSGNGEICCSRNFMSVRCDLARSVFGRDGSSTFGIGFREGTSGTITDGCDSGASSRVTRFSKSAIRASKRSCSVTAGSLLAPRSSASVISVSYTHLTLPTNREV